MTVKTKAIAVIMVTLLLLGLLAVNNLHPLKVMAESVLDLKDLGGEGINDPRA